MPKLELTKEAERQMKDLSAWTQKVVNQIIKNFNPNNLEGKNNKSTDGLWQEIRARDGIRIIYDGKNITDIFIKDNHKNTKNYIR